MIPGIICLLAANIAVIITAKAVADRFRPAEAGAGLKSCATLVFLLVRLTLISAIVLAAGLTRLLTPIGLLALSVIPLLLVRPRIAWPSFRPLPVSGVSLALYAAIAIVALRLLLQAWFFVPYSADALSYHLPKIAEWVQAGRFTRQLGVDTHAAFPAGFELIETWWVVFLHHDILIELAGIEFLVLAFFAARALARHLELNDAWATFSGLAFVLVPGLYLQATSALNDLPVAALVVSAAALSVSHAPPGLVLVAMALGAGVKGTFLFAIPGLILLSWLERPRQRWGAVDRKTAHERRAAVLAMRFAVLALAVGGFWYARNAAWFGNPLHPMGPEGVRETGGYVTIRYGISIEGALQNFSELVESRIGDREAAYSALSRRVSGWGALAFACGLPAMLLVLPANPRFRRLTASLALSLACVLLLVQHDDWFARFVLFFAIVPVLATALAAARDRAVLLVAIPALLLQFTSTMVSEELPAARVRQLAAQPWRSRSLAPLFDAHMDDLTTVGYYADNVGEAYWCYGPDYSRRIVYLRGASVAELEAEMRREQVEVLFASPGTLARQQVMTDALAAGVLRRVRKQMYQLRP